jgi:DNA-binding NarL/FixJ family response regulator
LIEKSIEINLIVIDPKSPGCFGFSSIYHIAKCLPDTQIVILTDAEFKYANFAQPNAPYHFINKSNDIKSILKIFNTILNENPSSSTDKTIEKPINKISKRHNQILNLLNKGYSNRQISIELGLAESTIKVHLFRLYKTIKVNSRLNALRYAKAHGLIFE